MALELFGLAFLSAFFFVIKFFFWQDIRFLFKLNQEDYRASFDTEKLEKFYHILLLKSLTLVLSLGIVWIVLIRSGVGK